MTDFYHYTLKQNISSIKNYGVFSGDSNFTDEEYFHAGQAGDRLGVREHYIDCVLKFSNDGRFKLAGIVPFTGRFNGGGRQFGHPGKPKPIAYHLITEKIWRMIP